MLAQVTANQKPEQSTGPKPLTRELLKKSACNEHS